MAFLLDWNLMDGGFLCDRAFPSHLKTANILRSSPGDINID